MHTLILWVLFLSIYPRHLDVMIASTLFNAVGTKILIGYNFFLFNVCSNVVSLADFHSEIASSNVALRSIRSEYVLPSKSKVVGSFNGLSRCMSTSKGRSMRSKVERRMRKESGKTLREIRRAKKIKKKLMTEEERLLYNLKRVCHFEVIIYVVDFDDILASVFNLDEYCD